MAVEQRKLTAAQAAELRARRAAGASIPALACAFGLSVSTVWQILQDITYREPAAHLAPVAHVGKRI